MNRPPRVIDANGDGQVTLVSWHHVSLTTKGSVLEGKWDPENFREIEVGEQLVFGEIKGGW